MRFFELSANSLRTAKKQLHMIECVISNHMGLREYLSRPVGKSSHMITHHEKRRRHTLD